MPNIIRLAHTNLGKHLYFWKCPHCHHQGTIVTHPHLVAREVEKHHALMSEDCAFDQDTVVVRRHKTKAA